MRYPRYTTYGDEELVAAARNLIPTGQPVPDARTLRDQANGPARSPSDSRSGHTTPGSRNILLKEHYSCVTYPDGATGSCRYVRLAPDWHQFQHRHHANARVSEAETPPLPAPPPAERFLRGVALPTQRFGQRMANTVEAIEEKAREFAAAAFAEAIRYEQQDRFRRATPPHGKKPDATTYQFSAKRAKEIGGKYALCRKLGDKLLPDSALFETMAEVNAAWQERGDSQLFVACACRWTRRWELPRFNPLYGAFPPTGGGGG